MRAPLLLGHRGVRGLKSYPENSTAAFDFALAQGCDGFEFDVRRSGDGKAVLCHDARVRRRNISTCRASTLRLPLLTDVLRRYGNSAFVDIELKVDGLEAIVVDILREKAPRTGYVVSSFLPGVIESVHKLDSKIPLGLICETEEQLTRWPGLPVQYAVMHHNLARPKVLGELRKAGKRTVIWTVNRTQEMRAMAQLGVDGIISDNPRLLVRTLRSSTTGEESV